jgi:predicted lipoprotein with Yx(FWY)xxD motif
MRGQQCLVSNPGKGAEMRTSRLHAVRRAGPIAGLLGALAITAIASAASGTSVGTHKTARGTVLANVRGYSLYMFAKDKQGGKSTCYSQCAKVWPPLLTSTKPVAIKGSGVNSKLLGTTRRTDGKLEVTYNGWPLYRYAPDTNPGDITGEGANQFGAKWYLMSTAGKILKPVCPPHFVKSGSECLPGAY